MAKWSIALAMPLFWLSACSSDEPSQRPSRLDLPSPPSRSGSRLEVTAWQADGDAVQAIGFYDTERLAPCTFAKTGYDEDGAPTFHCLRTAPVSVYYTDPSCTAPVGQVLESCHPVEPDALAVGYQVVRTATSCSLDARYFSIGAETSVSGQLYFGDVIEGCQPVPFPTGAFVTLEKADFSQHVAGTLGTSLVDAASGLAERVILGADGSAVLHDLRAESTGCTPVDAYGIYPGAGHPAERCAPLTATANDSIASIFSDGTCTEPAFGIYRCDEVPQFGAYYSYSQSNGTSCSSGVRYYELGPELKPAYSVDSGACAAKERDETYAYYAARSTVEVDVQTFPPLTNVTLGSGRLRVEYVATAAGEAIQPSGRWLDTELGIDCSPTKVSDGGARCLPAQSAGAFKYTDAGCSQPAYIFSPLPCDSAPSIMYGIDYTNDPCDPLPTRVLELQPHSGTVYDLDTSGLCTPSMTAPGTTAFVPVREVPLDTFAAVTPPRE